MPEAIEELEQVARPEGSEHGQIKTVFENPEFNLDNLKYCTRLKKINTPKLPSDLSAFTLEITDPEAFGAAIESDQLTDQFGELSFKAYEPGQNYDPNDTKKRERAKVALAEIGMSSKIFFVAKGNRIVGYLATSISKTKSNLQVGDLILVSVDPKFRGKENGDISKWMHEQFFLRENLDAVAAFTTRINAAASFRKSVEGYGFEFYCGNHPRGDLSQEPNLKQLLILKEISDATTDAYMKEGYIIPSDVPDEFLIIQGDPNPVPRARREEVGRRDDLLNPIFEKLLETQEKLGYEEPLYVKLVALKKGVLQ